MDSKSIRYQNTRLLVEAVGGVSNFADKIGKGQSQTSQFAGTNPIKGIGNKVAREIEEAFGKTHGWLDIPHSSNLYNLCDPKEISEDSDLEDRINLEFLSLIDSLNLLKTKGQLTSELIKALQAIINLGSKR